MTRKMGDKAFIDGAEPYTDPTIRRCAALYSDNPAEQPPELFRSELYLVHEIPTFTVKVDLQSSVAQRYIFSRNG